MTHYWFCFLDDEGQVRQFQDFDCEDDETALVEQRRVNEPSELWCGARRVRIFRPEPPAAERRRH